jgi:hypothetical protein
MRNAVTGALLSVWGVARNRGKRNSQTDLLLAGCSLFTLDDIADIPGFGAAMAEVGWAVETDEGVVLPSFFREFNTDPNGKTNTSAERQKRYREKKKGKGDVTRDVDADVTRDVTRDVTLRPREEKRREENKESLPTEVISSEPPAATHEPIPTEPAPEVILTFPTVGNVKSWDLNASHIRTWQEAYPGLDVLAECRKALAWVVSNPGKAKTARGMTAFLNSWLARVNDRPRTCGPAPPSPRPVFKSAGERLQERQMDQVLNFLNPPLPEELHHEPPRTNILDG